ncbi:MAG: NAD-dependent epimerase/dehydratase family protein [Candidatus Bathyarchaeia archaeon]
MRVLIFGAAGFVGRNLVERLSKEKDEVTASDALENPYGQSTKYIRVDVLDRNGIFEAVKGNEIVVHLAASPLVASLKDPTLNMRVNIEGTLNILDAARRHDVKKVIYSSASSVIGTPNYNPVDEEHPTTPKTPYAVAKKACEDYLRVYKEVYSLRYLVFRFFNLYGPWQTYLSGALVPNLHKTLLENNEFQVFGDGSSTRDFIYVEDVVDYFNSAITKNVENTTINMGTGIGTSIKQLIDLGSKVLRVTPRIAYKPSRPGEIGNFVADTKRLIQVFGARPRTSLEEGLRKSFSWLSAKQSAAHA